MRQRVAPMTDDHIEALRAIVRTLMAILEQLKHMTASAEAEVHTSSRQGVLAPGCVREHNMECGHE